MLGGSAFAAEVVAAGRRFPTHTVGRTSDRIDGGPGPDRHTRAEVVDLWNPLSISTARRGNNPDEVDSDRAGTVHPGVRELDTHAVGHCGQSVPEAVPETLSAAGTTSSADQRAVSLTSGNQPDRPVPEFL